MSQIKAIYKEQLKNKGSPFHTSYHFLPHSSILLLAEGVSADYIPQLASVNPEQLAISVCTVDGQRFHIGLIACFVVEMLLIISFPNVRDS